MKIAVVVPCFKVRNHVLNVLRSVPQEVDAIYCVDDACPEGSGQYIEGEANDPRIKVLYHDVNQGVGGAMVTGYRRALEDQVDVVVKLDGDGQMDPALIPYFIKPIIDGKCDYTKGNRFYNVYDLQGMPSYRLYGNAVLGFLTKLSSGYWQVFDPNNGYTAIHSDALKRIPLKSIAKGYFFESDMLFRLNMCRAVVMDLPMKAVYGEEVSQLRIGRIVWPFLKGHATNLFKRILYNYFLRDFNIGSVELVFGVLLLLFGIVFGSISWLHSGVSGVPATAGTVMLGALPVITGLQLLLSFLHYDISAAPRTPLQHIFSNSK